MEPCQKPQIYCYTMIHYKQKHLGMCVLLLSLHQLQCCFIWLICSSKKIGPYKERKKITTASSEEEEQFNHSTENMEVSFREHIAWIMMLSWISMNSSSQESMNRLATTTTKSIIEQHMICLLFTYTMVK